jgi:hypothetical protein
MGLVGVARAATEHGRRVVVVAGVEAERTRGRVDTDGEDKKAIVGVLPRWPTLPPLLEALASTSRCCWTLGLRKRASEIIIALVPQEERRKRSRFFLSNFSVLYLRRLKK